MKKLPQNIQALIGEIGERQVLLRLFLLIQSTPWEVFHNLGEAGYDVLLLNAESGERVRIEVKTRQKIYTTGKNSHRVHFFLTDGEYQACDFLAAYFLDLNRFYVVPKGDLKEAHAGERTRWRFTLTLNQQGEPHPRFAEYRDVWRSLHPDFAEGEKQVGPHPPPGGRARRARAGQRPAVPGRPAPRPATCPSLGDAAFARRRHEPSFQPQSQ